MSRAFVKEPDGDVGDDAPELPVSPHPNRVTPRGLRLLEAERDELTERRKELAADESPAHKPELYAVERRLRYLDKRIETAEVQEPEDQPKGAVGFGATVTVLDEEGTEHRFTIVGEDEADPHENRIGWTSPLARALMDSAVGDEVTWRRPRGDTTLEITGIDYADAHPDD